MLGGTTTLFDVVRNRSTDSDSGKVVLIKAYPAILLEPVEWEGYTYFCF